MRWDLLGDGLEGQTLNAEVPGLFYKPQRVGTWDLHVYVMDDKQCEGSTKVRRDVMVKP